MWLRFKVSQASIDMTQDLELMEELDTGWSTQWLPFGENGFGDLLVVDLDPSSDQPGRVFAWWHDDDPLPLGSSFAEWFTEQAHRLE